jgi:hypothetical protein
MVDINNDRLLDIYFTATADMIRKKQEQTLDQQVPMVETIRHLLKCRKNGIADEDNQFALRSLIMT